MITFLFTHALELLAVICGLINIYLIARVHILNWLFGMIAVALYFVIFLNAKLYADMGLQVVFFVLQFYGWYQWIKGHQTQTTRGIRRAKPFILFIACVATLLLSGVISFILSSYTDSTTVYIDAFTTALSLVAQWLMSKKWIEHWWLWMIVNIVSIKMYFIKELYFTSGLYGVYFLICLYGYFHWKKTRQQQRKEIAI